MASETGYKNEPHHEEEPHYEDEPEKQEKLDDKKAIDQEKLDDTKATDPVYEKLQEILGGEAPDRDDQAVMTARYEKVKDTIAKMTDTMTADSYLPAYDIERKIIRVEETLCQKAKEIADEKYGEEPFGAYIERNMSYDHIEARTQAAQDRVHEAQAGMVEAKENGGEFDTGETITKVAGELWQADIGANFQCAYADTHEIDSEDALAQYVKENLTGPDGEDNADACRFVAQEYAHFTLNETHKEIDTLRYPRYGEVAENMEGILAETVDHDVNNFVENCQGDLPATLDNVASMGQIMLAGAVAFPRTKEPDTTT